MKKITLSYLGIVSGGHCWPQVIITNLLYIEKMFASTFVAVLCVAVSQAITPEEYDILHRIARDFVGVQGEGK